MDEDPVIEVRDLVRKFGNRTVLNGVSFTVNKGDTMIIMGSSGRGKIPSSAISSALSSRPAARSKSSARR